MTNSGRESRRGDYVLGLISVLGIVCLAVCVIAGLAVLGWFIFAGLAMSRYGSNK